MEEVNAIVETEVLPISVADDIQIIYSDSATLKVILEAKHLERFLGEDPYPRNDKWCLRSVLQ